MATIFSKDASVTYANGYASKVQNFRVNVEAEDLNHTSLGDEWEKHDPGLKRWSGSYEALVASGTFGDGIDGWGFATSPSALATFKTTPNNAVSGYIIITGVEVSADVGGNPTKATFSFVGDGAIL